ncbi:MAG: hypothetical protein KatS3mg003_0060 [Candidatus Nitrosocaldaceae archaeon]|nr:MAG: hypothetical protein KatS3mg003_0060 [Candidatus Nitrosocaldaceae archaeon]
MQQNRANKRGILGIESAIVMIAFVVVAAALAFVVLNAGFGTTQQAKTTISSGLEEASSALEIAGKVVGNQSNAKLQTLTIPIKVSGGAGSVNVEEALTAVRYISTGATNVSYDNIYNGTLSSQPYSNFTVAVAAAVASGGPCEDWSSTDKSCAFIWWSSQRNTNDIIDPGETAALTIIFYSNDQPVALDKINAEIVVAKGAVLTVERQVPTLTDTIVDLE